ncbi:hypothetical protein [Marinibactrum halimedae]|uniref:Uncharacterized protein n=1 Tax=Marinibactrum halimedae TaxID=1444977 RepID=A0AA37TAI7_9GAMM|nr:hypothetical protein [Marinibactrum halimedae]MCD9460042.1 hypothetical protein [Marinibactrum halimedae]GLS26440.1 hypothetical protein GCM10007877_21560 [Marinibactrum halimedae]
MKRRHFLWGMCSLPAFTQGKAQARSSDHDRLEFHGKPLDRQGKYFTVNGWVVTKAELDAMKEGRHVI